MDLNEVKFTSDIIKTDVTALKVLKNGILLIGIGHVAYLYKLSNQKFLSKICVFSGQKIHGFLPANDSNAVVIFGGKQAKIYDLLIESSPEDQNDEGPEINVNFTVINKDLKFTDWIIDLIWIQNEKKIAILTAHNVIQIWDLESNSLSSSHCEEKCILYSGLLTEIGDQLLALAGTAFSQVVIWSTHGEQVLHRISGHKGVIFSISYSRNKNVIITTSDDRSVRIWNIVSKESVEPDTLEYWQGSTIESRAILFGHTARVIRSIILNETIISIGEDALMCAWDFNGTLLNKKKVIQGGGLWCLDHSPEQNIIVTGGSNSGVILHEGFCDSPVPKSSSLNFPDDRISAKKVVLTARGNIVCITEQGYVMYYDFEIEEWSVKHEISYAKSYLCMAVSLCRQFVALAGIDGQIDIFAENCKFDPNLKHFLSQKIIDGKILSVHWVVDRCLVVCDANGEITLWGSQNEACANIAKFTLPKCKERWLTAAALEPNHKKYLLAGDRCGNFHFFQKGITDPVETLSKIHGRMGINSIEFHNGKIMTTERDGAIKCFTLVESNDSHKLQYLHQIKLPFVWVEHFVDRQKNIICGFQQANLVVWDIKEQSNVLSVNCGGGHRSWDLTRSWQDFENKTQNIFRFVFIKNSTVQVVQSKYKEMAFKSIIQGFHSKEINDVKILMPADKTGDMFYIISGGEDTSVQIASCKTQKDNIIYENLIDLTYHLSSIRCMCLSPVNAKLCGMELESQEYVLYSAGGRAQICASKIILHKIENNDQIESQELGSYMLKGTDFERKKKEGGWSKLPKDVDAETRFMSLDYIIPENNKVPDGLFNNILLAGCSDGFLRVYKTTVSQNKCEFILQSSLEHHNRCILKVKCFNIKNSCIVLTLAVNGTVAFWDFTELVKCCEETSNIIKPFHELKIHKAGINSVDITLLDDDQIVLATGGDDNALHLNILKIKIDGNTCKVDKLCEWSCDKYHCSQITGLKLFKDNIMISVSIDQRVTVLKWSCNNTKEGLTCEFIAQYYTTVPDLQGFEAIKSDRKKISLCLFGKGIEILTVDL